MAKPRFAPPSRPVDAPFFEVPADPPLDFIGAPENPGHEAGGIPDDLPVDLSGLPPIVPPLDTPVEPPLFDTPPVDLPDLDGLA